MEVAIGIVTAAVLTDELFTWREGLGAVLIVAAGLTEFMRMPRWLRSPSPSPSPPPSPSPSPPPSPTPSPPST